MPKSPLLSRRTTMYRGQSNGFFKERRQRREPHSTVSARRTKKGPQHACRQAVLSAHCSKRGLEQKHGDGHHQAQLRQALTQEISIRQRWISSVILGFATRSGHTALLLSFAARGQGQISPIETEGMQRATIYERPRVEAKVGETVVTSTCGHNCGGRCVVNAHVVNGRIVKISTDPRRWTFELPPLYACVRGFGQLERV